MSNSHFLESSRLIDLGPANFARAIQRLLLHLGFTDVFNIDGPGDGGADIIAQYNGHIWVVQCKWKKRAPVEDSALDEVLSARSTYSAHTGVVVTNTTFREVTKKRVNLINEFGETIKLWNHHALLALFDDSKVCNNRIKSIDFRKYQLEAFTEAKQDLLDRNRALLILATGLGKTVVAGELIANHLSSNPSHNILVLAHTNELILQLERALWVHLTKEINTQLVNKHEKPDDLSGVTISTIHSALPMVKAGYSPDFIFIDEAHHIGGEGMFSELISILGEKKQLAVTATPWRSDDFNLRAHFGEPSYVIGIEEGMRLGYLSKVNYRLFVDNIDWKVVEEISDHGYSIKDLNKRLFLPQRDERIRDELLDVWNHTPNPRAIIFCQNIEHAELTAKLLREVPEWRNTKAIHSEIATIRERQKIMLDFRFGRSPILAAVDVLNEGVDVPDVNIVVFARVTHSRKIFVQQLGRGLRIADDKDCVEVLDFVSDIRRVAALLDLRAKIGVYESETRYLPAAHAIEFNDAKAEDLMIEWLEDAANLETASDETTLNFPRI